MDDPETAKFAVVCLAEHNRVRELHGASPLILSKALCEYASEWAAHLLRKNRLEHRQACEYGENIYRSVGSEIDGTDPVQSWYQEINSYNFKKHEFTDSGQFTQVVWKDSIELGVGIARRNDIAYVVCNYKPKGNIKGHFMSNVFPVTKVTK